ncbi:MAG: hypothetical protein AB7J13_07590 [Pyrinomonadaceae bacterium]
MPVSKKRKRAGKKVVRRSLQLPVRDTSKCRSWKFKPAYLIYLREDPDFLTMVKFGRDINALSLARPLPSLLHKLSKSASYVVGHAGDCVDDDVFFDGGLCFIPKGK